MPQHSNTSSSGKPRLRVVVAKPRGFCAGVTRAIEIVERALQVYGAPVYVRHEIVHNRHVVEALSAKGAVFVGDTGEIPEGAVTIFSAHGVSSAVESAAAARAPSGPPGRAVCTAERGGAVGGLAEGAPERSDALRQARRLVSGYGQARLHPAAIEGRNLRQALGCLRLTDEPQRHGGDTESSA